MVGPPRRHTQVHEWAEAIGENVRGDAEVRQGVVEGSGPEETLADDEGPPAVADDLKGTRDWARPFALEERI